MDAAIQDKISKARDAGYSDEEIVKYLGQKTDFAPKLKSALDAGYKPAEILSYLTAPTPAGEGMPPARRVDFASATPEERRQMKLEGVKSAKNITAGVAGAVPGIGQNIISLIPGGERAQQSIINMLSGAGSQPYQPGTGQESINALIAEATGGEPTSKEAQIAKTAAQIGLTLGAPGAAAKGLAALRAPAAVTEAIGTGGFGAASIPGKLAGGAAAGGISAGVVNPDVSSVLLGAGLGGALPLVSPLIAGTSALWQKAFPTAEQKTAGILQKVAGPEIDAIRQAAAAAPEGQLVAPALADIKNPQMQTLARMVAERDASRKFAQAQELQQAEHTNTLADIAGGRSQAEARASAEATKKASQNIAGGIREEAIAGAEEGTKKYLTAEMEAAQNRELAAQSVEDVRRFEAAGGRAGARAAATTTVPGQPRVPGRYTYMGELEKKAGAVAGQRAGESLEYGAAARSAEQRLQDLKDAGVEPLNIGKVSDAIRNIVTDPKQTVSPAVRSALGKVDEELRRWANQHGTINADAIANIRSNVVNEEIRKALSMTGAAPSAIEKQTAEIMGKLKPVIDDVIVKAGGTKWGDYLRAYEQGMQQFRQSRMGADLMDLYRKDPSKFAEVIRKQSLEPVEGTFGYGRYDIEREMGPQKFAQLQKIADDVERSAKMEKMARAGETLTKEYLGTTDLKLPATGAKSQAINYVLDKFRSRLKPAVLNQLEEAFSSGKTMRELLDLVPSQHKAEFADKALDAMRQYGIPVTANQLAPENKNALSR